MTEDDELEHELRLLELEIELELLELELFMAEKGILLLFVKTRAISYGGGSGQGWQFTRASTRNWHEICPIHPSTQNPSGRSEGNTTGRGSPSRPQCIVRPR